MFTINSSLRGRTVQPNIVTAVVARLRAAVPGYNDQNCFESDQPVPAAFSGGRECCTVSIGAGSFPHEFFAGAGSATLVEDGSLIITPMIEVRTDRSWRQKNQLLDGRGLLERKRQILVALFGAPDWEPADGARPLLRDLLAPLRSSQPGEVMVGEARMVALQLSAASSSRTPDGIDQCNTCCWLGAPQSRCCQREGFARDDKRGLQRQLNLQG